MSEQHPRTDGHAGIRCGGCGCSHLRVVNTRQLSFGGIRRRRECRNCGRRLTTIDLLQGGHFGKRPVGCKTSAGT